MVTRLSPYQATQLIYQRPHGPLAIACLDELDNCMKNSWLDSTERTYKAREILLHYFEKIKNCLVHKLKEGK